jgi:membrane protein implicated in regulation of membrane protease activity
MCLFFYYPIISVRLGASLLEKVTMNIELLYWHWLLLGMVLVVAELFVPSFTILWFGLGAVLVGLVSLLVTMSLTIQLALWAISSVVLTVLWFKYFKTTMLDKTNAGRTSQSVIGEFGQVIKVATEGSRGQVRFVIPILGDDEWDFISEDHVDIGDRVYIKEISGNTLIVVKSASI